MLALTIRLKKQREGSAALTCTRPDGTVTWQRQEGGRAVFFALHDLTHYAVETILGHRRGFFGLVAAGWDFSDFGAPWPRGPIPADADPAELIVGFLDAERASGAEWIAAELHEQAAQFYAGLGLSTGAPVLTGEELLRIRALRRDLFAGWDALPPGEAPELPFDASNH